MLVNIYKFDFLVSNSYMENDKSIFKIEIKIFDNKNKINKDMFLKNITGEIQAYINKKGINANVEELYNLLFSISDYFFTFKIKHKDILAGNNLYLQFIIS